MQDRSLFKVHKIIERVPSKGEVSDKAALSRRMLKKEADYKARNNGKSMPVDSSMARAANAERRALDKRLREFMSDASS